MDESWKAGRLESTAHGAQHSCSGSKATTSSPVVYSSEGKKEKGIKENRYSAMSGRRKGRFTAVRKKVQAEAASCCAAKLCRRAAGVEVSN